MIEWSEQHQMIRDAIRRFVEEEIKPNQEALEHGDLPPYDILRKLYSTFGMDEMARTRFDKQIALEKRIAAGEEVPKKKPRTGDTGGRGDSVAMSLIPIIELCRYCPGLVTAMGVSTGLTGAAIMEPGSQVILYPEGCATMLLSRSSDYLMAGFESICLSRCLGK